MKVIKDDFIIEFLHEFENAENGNEDIIVTYKENTYSGTLFTISNISKLMENYLLSGECAGGSYFYCPDMIIVKDLKRPTIIEAISNIIKEGEIDMALKVLTKSPSS
jgi:hypothetical protein